MTSIGIGIGIGDTGPVFTWYRIHTKICSIAHPYFTDPDKPRPREHAAKGARPCCTALEKRKRKLGVHLGIKIYSYESQFCLLTILMDSQVSKSLKQRLLILLLCRPALHLSLSLSLSLSHSDRQISSNKLFQLYTYFHTAMRSIINGHRCGCCAVLKL